MSKNPTLVTVVPVHNEQENLIPLLRDWQPVFQGAGVPYREVFIDDGSTDNSVRLLEEPGDARIKVVTQPNAGHGPAILHGYRLAIDAGAEWVFQIDSDHQLEPGAFEELWYNRERYDLLLAEREGKDASFGRRL